MAGEQVKLYGSKRSPFSCRVEIALKLKGVEYEFIEEDFLFNKSDDLLKYNPIYKKIPVLLHNEKSIVESAIIVEYIDDTFKGPKILPEDPYEKANARFWTKVIDDKITVALKNSIWGQGEEQVKAKEELLQLLKTLEKQLKGNKFFGGDTIGLIDIVADFIGHWLGVLEEVFGVDLVSKDKFPELTQWMDDFVSVNVVKESLLPRDALIEIFRAQFGKA